jgi:hypothetical protein
MGHGIRRNMWGGDVAKYVMMQQKLCYEPLESCEEASKTCYVASETCDNDAPETSEYNTRKGT